MASQFYIRLLCPQCSFSSDELDVLQQHIYQEHPYSLQLSSFKCAQCEYQTDNAPEYDQHLNERHRPTVLICTFCDFECHDAAIMEDHISGSHTSKLIINEECICSICQHKSPNQALHNIHIQRCHSSSTNSNLSIKQFLCQICFYTTSFKADFTQHKKSAHIEKCFQCNECLHIATTKNNLQRHMRNIHKISKFLCDLCGWSGMSLFKLEQHQKSHFDGLSNRQFKCSMCDYSFSDKPLLIQHIFFCHK